MQGGSARRSDGHQPDRSQRSKRSPSPQAAADADEAAALPGPPAKPLAPDSTADKPNKSPAKDAADTSPALQQQKVLAAPADAQDPAAVADEVGQAEDGGPADAAEHRKAEEQELRLKALRSLSSLKKLEAAGDDHDDGLVERPRGTEKNDGHKASEKDHISPPKGKSSKDKSKHKKKKHKEHKEHRERERHHDADPVANDK